MNSLQRTDGTYSSSESSSSDEQPDWYVQEMTQEERVNTAATATYADQQDLQEGYQEVLEDRNILRIENGELRVQLAAEQETNGELTEAIQAYQEDRTAHQNVRAEIENTSFWNRCKWVGAIALQVLFVGLAIAVIALILA